MGEPNPDGSLHPEVQLTLRPLVILTLLNAFQGLDDRRKNLVGEVLVTVKAMTGTASLAITQFGEAKLVVLCKMLFVAEAAQKRTA